MSRIAATFRRLKKANEAALIPYVTVGYPSLEMTRQLVPIMARQGADLIEMGVPFSDPMADGATVQRSSEAALAQGVTLAACLNIAAEARRANDVPLLFMTYYNPVLRYGLERFVVDCAQSGVDGLIVPDLPPDEAGDLHVQCEAAGIDLIFLVAPTSTNDRLKRVAEMASGFIYCVSLVGVTGARAELSEGIDEMLTRVRRYTDLPLVVGFGISTPEHVAKVSRWADGAVVASALINLIDSLPEDDVIPGVSEFVRDLKEATVRG